MRIVLRLLAILPLVVFAFGATALADGTDAVDNYVAGRGAGANMETDGTGARAATNTFVGATAGNADTTGSANVGLGYGALRALTTGRGNVGVGMLAGQDLTTSNDKLYIQTGYYPSYGIFGDFSTGYFGVNTTSPASAWDMGTGTLNVGTLSYNAGPVTVSDSLVVSKAILPTGTQAKGIDFVGMSPLFADADDAWVAMGTWNDGIDIRGQTEHFVPLQVHLDTRSNIAKDIAAARFRVDTDSTVTNQAVGNLQLRQNLGHALASSAILNASVTITDSVVVGTGSLLGGYFSIEGTGYIRKAGANDCTPLVAVNNNTGAITVDNVLNVLQNGTGTTIGEIINVTATNGTASVGVNINENGGTITKDIALQNGETIDNTTDGDVVISGNILGTQKIYTVTSDTTLTAAQTSGGLWVARPLAGKYTVTLPTAAAGQWVEFFVADTDSLLITAAASDSLLTSAGAAWKTTSTVAGTVKLVCMDAVRWVMMSTVGTWTSY